MPRLFFPTQKDIYRNPQEIREEIARIARDVCSRKPEVEEVILFGSYASGHPGYFSDLDILVVVSQDSRRPVDRVSDFLLLFQDAPLPVDVFVLTREEVTRRMNDEDPFVNGILKNGLKIS